MQIKSEKPNLIQTDEKTRDLLHSEWETSACMSIGVTERDVYTRPLTGNRTQFTQTPDRRHDAFNWKTNQ